jgi:hypothetical protein
MDNIPVKEFWIFPYAISFQDHIDPLTKSYHGKMTYDKFNITLDRLSYFSIKKSLEIDIFFIKKILYIICIYLGIYMHFFHQSRLLEVLTISYIILALVTLSAKEIQ